MQSKEKKIRILYVSNAPHIGGGNSSLVSIIQCMEERGLTTLTIVPGKGALADLLSRLRIRFKLQNTQLAPLSKVEILYSAARFLKTLCFYRPHIVHFNDIHCYKVLSRLSKFIGARIICHMRHFSAKSTVDIMMDCPPDLILFNSEYNAERTKPIMKEAFLNRSSVIYNTFRKLDYFSPSTRAETRRKFGIPDDVINISVVGNVNPLKGHEIFISSLNFLASLNNKTSFIATIVGDDVTGSGILERCRLQAERLGVKNIKFVGFVSDASSAYAAADILVIPSEEEPFGRVAVEAVLSETQVVAFNNSGLREILLPLRTPILVNEFSGKQLALGLAKALNSPASLASLKADSALIERRFCGLAQEDKLFSCYLHLRG